MKLQELRRFPILSILHQVITTPIYLSFHFNFTSDISERPTIREPHYWNAPPDDSTREGRGLAVVFLPDLLTWLLGTSLVIDSHEHTLQSITLYPNCYTPDLASPCSLTKDWTSSRDYWGIYYFVSKLLHSRPGISLFLDQRLDLLTWLLGTSLVIDSHEQTLQSITLCPNCYTPDLASPCSLTKDWTSSRGYWGLYYFVSKLLHSRPGISLFLDQRLDLLTWLLGTSLVIDSHEQILQSITLCPNCYTPDLASPCSLTKDWTSSHRATVGGLGQGRARVHERKTSAKLDALGSKLLSAMRNCSLNWRHCGRTLHGVCRAPPVNLMAVQVCRGNDTPVPYCNYEHCTVCAVRPQLTNGGASVQGNDTTEFLLCNYEHCTVNYTHIHLSSSIRYCSDRHTRGLDAGTLLCADRCYDAVTFNGLTFNKQWPLVNGRQHTTAIRKFRPCPY
ncbi:hypothetical protein J6590_078086 [Homalodisca vitripennis]|nr:hypothetical protein J6590_078086 [Homalodisca vitripennis]